MNFLTLILTILHYLLPNGYSFSTVNPPTRISSFQSVSTFTSLPRINSKTTLFSTSEDEVNILGDPKLDESETSAPEAAVTTKVEPAVVEATSAPYPIDLPSPILLSASMVLAIASTGSLFELTGGTPTLGFGPQAALAAIGLPSSLFLIYAAILKGAAETEEDDKNYNKPRGF